MKISVQIYKFTAKLILLIAAVVFIAVIVFVILQVHGRNRLYGKTVGAGPDLTQVQFEETLEKNDTQAETKVVDNWQEGDVRYNGVHYRFNSDILTFLFMGVDKNSTVKPVKNGIDGGQSDAMFLVALNPTTKEVSVIAINRNTMTDIAVYDEDGRYNMNLTAQICLQHGYGDGAASSCERSMDAVSNLFYDLPIHGYCAINMGAISLINDAVGGVELTAIETVPQSNIKEGQTITLTGNQAYQYLHNRDIKSFGSADRRLDRQKQYITAYAAKAVSEFKNDITLPVTLYNTLNKYMVTDITLDEVSYLATQVSGYTFSSDHIYSLEGETRMGDEFEEFYVDEKALYELILKVFYMEVD